MANKENPNTYKKKANAKRRKKRLFYKRLRLLALIAVLAVVLSLAVKAVVANKDDSSSSSSYSSASVQSSQNSTAPSSSAEIDNKPDKGEFATLVNVHHPLEDDFDVTTREIKGTGRLFDVRAADRLEKMLDDAARAGYPMYLVSTYRTIDYQKGLYNNKVKEYLNMGYDQRTAESEAAKWVAIPGTSEHNLGLAADIVSSIWYNSHSDLTQDFEETEHFKWLYENCADYGFILRFPKGKESITEIVYEPWHYRYVGQEVAHYIMENDLTLEEFWED